MAKITRGELQQLAQSNPARYLEVFGDNDPLGASSYIRQTLESAPKPPGPSIGGELVKGVQAGYYGLKGAVQGSGALAADLVGADGTRDALLEAFLRTQEDAKRVAPAVPSITDVNSGRSGLLYAAAGLGSLLPFAAASVASGGLGAGASLALRGGARAVAERAAAGIAEGQLAKAAEQKLGVAGAEALIAPRAAQAAQAAVQKAAIQGATIGAGANSIATESGLIYGNTFEQTGQTAPGTALALGVPAGLLDLIPEAGLLKTAIGAEAKQSLAKFLLSSAGKEGATEVGQTVLEAAAPSIVDDRDYFTKENAIQALDAGLLGALGGAAAGGASRAAAAARSEQPAVAQQPLEPLDAALSRAVTLRDELAQTRGLPTPQPVVAGFDGTLPPTDPSVERRAGLLYAARQQEEQRRSDALTAAAQRAQAEQARIPIDGEFTVESEADPVQALPPPGQPALPAPTRFNPGDAPANALPEPAVFNVDRQGVVRRGADQTRPIEVDAVGNAVTPADREAIGRAAPSRQDSQIEAAVTPTATQGTEPVTAPLPAGARQSLDSRQILTSPETSNADDGPDSRLDDRRLASSGAVSARSEPSAVRGPAGQSLPAENGEGGSGGGGESRSRRAGFAEVSRIPFSTLRVDPKTFQFRTKVGATGTDDRLSGVEQFDDLKAGNFIVFEKKDGTRFIADGHHRYELAKRLGVDSVNAIVRREVDGYTPASVRAEAAATNIAANNGTPLDVAKLFRDTPGGADAAIANLNLNRKSTLVQQGRNLAKLSDDAFDLVAGGVISNRDAAVIGATFSDPEQQQAAIKTFARVKPESEGEAQILARDILRSGFEKSQGQQADIFGGQDLDDLLKERVKVTAALERSLKTDKSLFASLVDRAGRIESLQGNAVNREGSKSAADEAAQLAGVLDSLSNTAFSGELNAAARAYRDDPGKIASIVDGLKTKLRAAADQALGRVEPEPELVDQGPGLFEPTPEFQLESYTKADLEAKARRESDEQIAKREQIDREAQQPFKLESQAQDNSSASQQADLLAGATPADLKREPVRPNIPKQSGQLFEAANDGKNTEVRDEQSRRDAASSTAFGARPRFVQLGLFTHTIRQRAAVRDGIERTGGRRVALAEVGRLPTGLTHARQPSEVAHVAASIRKAAQEHLVAVVTSESHEVLAVLRHQIGGVANAGVEAAALFGGSLQVPKAKHVYIVHNHPAGTAELSGADRNVGRRAQDLLENTGLEYRGILAVTPGGKFAYEGPTYGISDRKIDALARKGSVPLLERTLARSAPGKAPVIKEPADAIRIADELSKGRDGVILLSTQLQPSGFLPIPLEQLLKLRTGDTGTGAAALLRGISETNARSLIVTIRSAEKLEDVASNLAAFATASDVSLLDVISGPVSLTLRGQLQRNRDRFYSIAAGSAPGLQRDAVRRALAKRIGEARVRQLERSGLLRILDVPPNDVEQDAEGYYEPDANREKGRVTLVASNLSADTVLPTFVHELGGHGGFERYLSPKQYQKLQATFDRLVARGDGAAVAADQRAKAAGGDVETTNSERLAYLVGEAERLSAASKPIGLPVRQIVRDLISSVKAFVFDKTGVVLGDFSAADLKALADRQINRAVRETSGPAYRAFSSDSGTLGIPRADLPQIKTAHRGALVNFLAARGIGHSLEEIDPRTLTPSQAEYAPDKVEKAKQYLGRDRSILVSSDGYIVDGHHQYLARLETSRSVRAIRFDAPFKQLVAAIKEFPSAGSSEVQQSRAQGQSKQDVLRRAKEFIEANQPKAEQVAEPSAEYKEKAKPLLEQAAAQKPEFDAKLQQAAEAAGGTAKFAAVKSIDRAAQKLANDYGGDASLLRDAVRGTIVVESERDLSRAVKEIKSRFDVVRVKDRFEAPTNVGYSDIVVNVKLPGGIVGEIQVNLPEFVEAKSVAHKLYEVARSLPKGDPNVFAADDLQRELYDEARESARSRWKAISSRNSISEILDPSWLANAVEIPLRSGVNATDDPSGNIATGISSTSSNTEPAGSSGISGSAGIAKSSDRSLAGSVLPEVGRRQYSKDSLTQRLGKFVDEFLAKKVKDTDTVLLGDTPEVLQAVGAPARFLEIQGDVIRKALEGKHAEFGITPEIIKALPGELADPALVFRSATQPGALLVITRLTDRFDDPIAVAVHLNKNSGRLTVNRIESVHSRRGAEERFIRDAGNGLLAYYNDETLALPTTVPLYLGKVVQAAQGQVTKLLSRSEFVNSRQQGRTQYSRRAPIDPAKKQAFEKAGLGAVVDDSTLADRIKAGVQRQRARVDANLRDRLVEGLFDQYAPLKRAEEAAAAAGAPIDVQQSAYLAARLAAGSGSTVNASLIYGAPQLRDGIVQKKEGSKGLLEVLDPVKDDLPAFTAWIVGKRAEGLASQGRENNLTPADIAELLAEGKGKEREFEAVAKSLREYNTTILELARDAGLLSNQQVASYSRERYYVPFFRVQEGDDPTDAFRQKKGLSGQTAGIKQLKGGEDALNDPIANLIGNTARLIDASLKNVAAQRVAESFPTVVKRVAANHPGAATPKTNIAEGLVAISYNGQKIVHEVADPALLRAVSSLNLQPITGLGAFRWTKNLLTRTVTVLPTFLANNFVRDTLQTQIINRDGFTVADAARGARATFKGLLDSGKASPELQAIAFAGASFIDGNVYGGSPEEASRALEAALKAKGFNKSQLDSVIDKPKKLLKLYNALQGASENANRVAVYQRAIAAGKSKAQAAYESRDTLDFALKGNFTFVRVLSDILPFFNARLQGLYKLGRAVRENPTGIAAKGLVLALASTALALSNDDDKRYKELEEWDKDTFWHIFIGEGDAGHFRIPKPFELGLIFGTLPERIGRSVGGEGQSGKDERKALARALWSTLGLNPIPQLVRPVTEAAFNYDTFRQAPIDSRADEGKLPEARYNERTSLLFREIGELTGISPKRLQHVYEGYLGGVGSVILTTGEVIIRSAAGEVFPTLEPQDYPVLGSFYRSGVPRSTRYAEDLYELAAEADEVYKTIRYYRENGRIEDAAELLNENRGLLAARGGLNQARGQLTALRKQVAQAMRRRDVTPDEKLQLLQDLRTRINAITARSVQTAEKTRERLDG